jgi:cytochrome c oxidase assembly protein subunit 11
MHRKYEVIFKGETDPELDWTFEPIQDRVTVHAGEPALMFYKTHNKGEKPLVGRSLLNFRHRALLGFP